MKKILGVIFAVGLVSLFCLRSGETANPVKSESAAQKIQQKESTKSDKKRKDPQYKKYNRDQIVFIEDGKYDEAIKYFEKFLQENPDDLESFYGLAMAHGMKGEIEKAMGYVKRAVEAGLPFGRFLAGPRNLLKPLTESAEFQALAKKQGVELIHGPTLGCLTDRSVKFWVRTAHETPVHIGVSSTGTGTQMFSSKIIKTDKTKDFTAVLSIEGLHAETLYKYDVLVDGKKIGPTHKFRTFPAAGKKARFQIGFGGGAGYTPKYERMWDTIASHNLPAFLLLGDNVYIDHPTSPAANDYCYYRRQSRPEFRRFASSTALYAIWDDHDFTTNDQWGGPEIADPDWKIPVWKTFRNNWVNPAYATGSESQPGCWFSFSIADVDVIMLDCRYYRESPKNQAPSMLGPVQKKWLLERLASSTGTFKILASSVPWTPGTKPGSRDTWDGYKEEREEIWGFIEEKKIDGVLLLTADRHRSDARRTERPKGYPLFEFESSRLTNIHTHNLVGDYLFAYNEKCSFATLTFDTTLPDPEVTYQIRNIDDEPIQSLTLKRSQLTHRR